MLSAGNKDRTGGFSLLELIVVMLIISVSAVAIAAALPRIATGGPAIELAATRLAAGLKKARMRAIARERVITVAIEPGAHRYRIEAAGVVRLPDTVRIQSLGSTVVRFYPDGGADPAAIHLAGNQRTLHIDVSPMTGKVTVR